MNLNPSECFLGTTIGSSWTAFISTIVEDDRPAFLEGIILGVAMRKAADALEGRRSICVTGRHKLKIAIDIDGVLADQVGAVLKVIEKEYGLKYLKSDVNHAHWAFGEREIWSEIARLLADPEYTLSIPLIEGSQDGIEELSNHDVCVVTARRPNTEDATKQWLSTNFPCLTEYYHARTGMKHNIPSDVLIDDLDMNIVEFVKSDPNRRGILFVHPWSINGTDIENYSNQVHYCPTWKSVVMAIHDIDFSQGI